MTCPSQLKRFIYVACATAVAGQLCAQSAQQMALARQQAALRAQQQKQAQYNRPASARGINAASAATAGVGGARGVAGQASLGGLNTALSAFAMDTGRLPTTAEGLNALLVQPPGVRNWRGPYIAVSSWKNPLHDPWGSPYRYINTTTSPRRSSFAIISNGPDRLPNTNDDMEIRG